MNNPPSPESSSIGDAAAQAREKLSETASEVAENSERCIRRNPAPAIATAFGGGVLIGLIIGFSIAEAQHRTLLDHLRDHASSWRRRMHFD